MAEKFRHWSRRLDLRVSLRAKVALGVAFPLLLILTLLSLIHFLRERQILEDQLQLSAQQLGEITLGSLYHAMLINDQAMLEQALVDVGEMENIQEVQIINLEGQVKVTSNRENLGTTQDFHAAGCEECHQYVATSRPRTTHLTTNRELLRISAPIPNSPACANCHDKNLSHLGVLLIDASLVDLEQHLLVDLQTDLAISLLSTVLIALVMFFLIHKLIVQRVEAFSHPLAEFASGNFTSRLPGTHDSPDELDKLAQTFNQMAADLENHIAEQEERSQVRIRTITEERERIARELHDGMAQLLGYVNTKALAARLYLKRDQRKAADRQLEQLEEAGRELFAETREAILGLKMAQDSGDGLIANLNNFAKQFTHLSDLPVEISYVKEIKDLSLPLETDLEILRIVQEALTNIRKHAFADQAWINIKLRDSTMVLEICDDGIGFNPNQPHTNNRPHFGIQIMQERAQALGALFNIKARDGGGTKVELVLKLEDDNADAGR